MCQDTFWNITIEDTYRRKAICLQDVRQDILKLHEKIHTRQKIYACRMCNDTFWNVRQRNTQEKSLLDVRQDLCKQYWPEMSQENLHRRKTICVWDVQRNLCQLDRPEMSCEDTHRRKALCLHDVWTFWNVTINHLNWDSWLSINVQRISIYNIVPQSLTTLTTNPLTHKLQRNGYSSCFH